MELELHSLRNGYAYLGELVVSRGRRVTVRGMSTHELLNVTYVLPPERANLVIGVGRRLNTRLAAVEALSLIAGVARRDVVLAAAPSYGDVLVDPEGLNHAAYGPRIAEQLTVVLDQLTDKPTTRQAVLQIWRPDDLTYPGDRPCTLSLQFLVRSGQLHLHTMMRSQDFWLGVPYDVFMFTQLQLTVAHVLNLDPGAYVHHVGSLHVYDRDVAAVGQLRVGHDTIDYPLGVRPALGDTPWFTMIQHRARGLLETGESFPEFAATNPWYTEQLRQVHERLAAARGGESLPTVTD